MTTKRDRMYARIEQHGRNLLAIFPNATERDPVKLCKELLKLETFAAAIGLQLCNGPELQQEDADKRVEAVLSKASKLLGNASDVPVFVNLDPRGYALKIDDAWLTAQRADHRTAFKAVIHRDFGGYGILAPDLSVE